MDNWRNKWIIFGHVHDGSAERVYQKLFREGINPVENTLYAGFRLLLQDMGLEANTSHIWHGTTYVGTEADLDSYLYTIKRQHGEL